MRFQGLATAFLVVAGSVATLPSGADELGLADRPLLIGDEPPPVTVMLDNSGSMTRQLHDGNYDNSTDYFGMFDSDATYTYDESIPVNESAYNVDVVDAKGAFVKDSCTAGSSGCWSGNFLNWLVTRRIDASREVMIGGRREDISGVQGAGNYDYKVLGNNAPADGRSGSDINKSDGNSGDYSPIPDGAPIRVRSPAAENDGNQQAAYVPYAQLRTGGLAEQPRALTDVNNDVVGEYGKAAADQQWTTVNLTQNYTDPIVVAKPITIDGDNPSEVRVRNVSGGSFEIRVEEWPYLDGGHKVEAMSYVVLERGAHDLGGNVTVSAGSVDTDQELNASGSFESVSSYEGSPGFSSAPTLISTVTTTNEIETVTTRHENIQDNSFEIAMQEQASATAFDTDNDGRDPSEEPDAGHAQETIHYIAMEQGDWSSVGTSDVAIESDVVADGVDHNTSSVSYNQTFDNPAFVLADMQTTDDTDPASLRLESAAPDGFSIFAQEEESSSSDDDHSDEDLGYVALSGAPTLNVALAVQNEPKGVLQDIDDKVRLGASFYRFDTDPNDGNITDGYTGDGGTLQFALPKNPFVEDPSASQQSGKSHVKGYRRVDGYNNSDLSDIVDAVESYPLVWGTTPMGENLWELVQYYEQDDPYYSGNGPASFVPYDQSNNNVSQDDERDPFYDPAHDARAYCVQPSAIVFTDGEPWKDVGVPSNIRDFDDDVGNPNPDLPNDGSDRDDILDDVATWAHTTNQTEDPNNLTPKRDLRSGNRRLGPEDDDNQFLNTYTVAFQNSIPQVLEDTADQSDAKAYRAEGGDELAEALKAAFQASLSRGSSAGAAVSSGTISSDTKIFSAVFNSENWSGDVEAFGVTNSGVGSRVWKASDDMPSAGSRNIYTNDSAFTDGGLSSAEKALLSYDRDYDNDSNDETISAAQVISFLRGDDSNEVDQSGGFLRDRGDEVLGDIVNSTPRFVPEVPRSGYDPTDFGGSNGYEQFQTDLDDSSTSPSRNPHVYVGANDGMLHAFDASDPSNLSGDRETFAYIPSMLLPKLNELSKPSYAHQFYVDGSPTVLDAKIDHDNDNTDEWRTVLVGGLRAGGQGIYALDVTEPENFDDSDVLWEFDDSVSQHLGFTFGQPNIVRLNDGEWYAVFGNGYNNTANTAVGSAQSSNGHAVLYVVDLLDGTLEKSIDVEAASGLNIGSGTNAATADPNGLSSVAMVDEDDDGNSETAYAGDIKGNLWKFDLTGNNSNQWELGNGGDPLFRAGADQPITGRPNVADNPEADGLMVYFGTGKFIETTDNTASNQAGTQAFYALWDEPGTDTELEENDLVEQTIDAEEQTSANNGDTVGVFRSTSDKDVSYNSSDKGWFMKLDAPATNVDGATAGDHRGERVVGEPTVLREQVVFSTIMPSDEICSAGLSGWRMQLGRATGGTLSFTPFDTDDDGDYDADDHVNGGDPAGTKTAGGEDPKFVPSSCSPPCQADPVGTSIIVPPDGDPDRDPIRGKQTVGRRSWLQSD